MSDMANLMKSTTVQGAANGELPQSVKSALDSIKPMINMMKSNNGPQSIEKMVLSQFPQIGGMAKMLNGGDPNVLLRQMLQSKGISYEDVIKYLQQ